MLSVFLSVCMLVSPMAQAGPVGKPAPYTDFQAVAVRNLLHDTQTVGGFVRWASIGLPKTEINKFKKWLMANNVPEDQFFPAYKVKKNVVSYGRFQMTINKDHIILNKKRYNFKPGQSLADFAEKVCKDLKCGVYAKNKNFDSLFFNEADAIAQWLIYGLVFAGGFVVGRYGWPWQWFRRRPVEETVTTTYGTAVAQGVATGVTAVGMQELISAVRNGGVPKCEGKTLQMCGGSSQNFWGGTRNGNCETVPGGLDKELTCEENRQMIVGSAQVNDNEVNDGFVRASRASSSIFNPPPAKKKKPWDKRDRWH